VQPFDKLRANGVRESRFHHRCDVLAPVVFCLTTRSHTLGKQDIFYYQFQDFMLS